MIQNSFPIASSVDLFTSCSKRGLLVEWFHREVMDSLARHMLEKAPPKSFLVYNEEESKTVRATLFVRDSYMLSVVIYHFSAAN